MRACALLQQRATGEELLSAWAPIGSESSWAEPSRPHRFAKLGSAAARRSVEGMGRGWIPAEGKLDLEKEGRTEWPAAEIAAAGPHNIRELNLSGNKLTRISGTELAKLTNLEKLYMMNNQLTALPPEIGCLVDLRALRVSGNQLTALPPEIGRLAALEELWAENNQLTALPPEIGRLAALKSLAVSSNRLTAMPPETGRLAALQKLWVHSNPVVDSWPERVRSAASRNRDGLAQCAAVLPYFRSLSAPAPAPAPSAPPAPTPAGPVPAPARPVHYVHVDAALVLRYCDALEAAGIKIWVDRELEAGQRWMAKIGEAMQRCRAYVCFLSPAYVGSKNCDDEMQFAHHTLRIPKFPVWLVDPKTVKLPVDYEMMLVSVNWTMQRGEGAAAADAAAGDLIAGLRDFLRHGGSRPGPGPGRAPAEQEKSCSVQ
eukprot:tig00000600_g2261.t1